MSKVTSEGVPSAAKLVVWEAWVVGHGMRTCQEGACAYPRFSLPFVSWFPCWGKGAAMTPCRCQLGLTISWCGYTHSCSYLSWEGLIKMWIILPWMPGHQKWPCMAWDGTWQVLRRADGHWWLPSDISLSSMSQQPQTKTANQCCCVGSVPKQLAEVKMG